MKVVKKHIVPITVPWLATWDKPTIRLTPPFWVELLMSLILNSGHNPDGVKYKQPVRHHNQSCRFMQS